MPSPPFHDNWYKCDGTACPPPVHGATYQFPLPEVIGAPVPSRADYNPKNCAWLIEFFGQILSQDPSTLELRYENNTPKNPNDDIFVRHPGGSYLPDKQKCGPKSDAMRTYEIAAKKSKLLKLYQDHSPAGIKYFQPICPSQLQ